MAIIRKAIKEIWIAKAIEVIVANLEMAEGEEEVEAWEEEGEEVEVLIIETNNQMPERDLVGTKKEILAGTIKVMALRIGKRDQTETQMTENSRETTKIRTILEEDRKISSREEETENLVHALNAKNQVIEQISALTKVQWNQTTDQDKMSQKCQKMKAMTTDYWANNYIWIR